jgi:GDPmannose 4,6-dehydratase
MAAARIAHRKQDCLYLGNLDAQRDWGHARDYVEGMWRILQQPEPDDYVLATGVTTSVRDFTTKAFEFAGIQLAWEGEGVNEVGREVKTGEIWIRIDPQYFRPVEVDLLRGDASKAKTVLGWEPISDLDQLVEEMVQADLTS